MDMTRTLGVLNGYLTRYTHGTAWIAGRPIEEQPGYARQVRWWIAMRRRGILSWAGVPADHPDQLLVRWHCATLDEARKLAAGAPFVRRGIFREVTTPASMRD